MFIIYRIGDGIVGYENTIAFEAVSKAVYGIFISIILFWSSYLITDKWKQRMEILCISFLAFFATFTAIQMQAEMTCVALSILVTACVIHNKRWSFILAGMIGGGVFWFKSIFVLMFLVSLIGVLIYDDQKAIHGKSYVIAGLSFLISEIILVFLIYTIYPQEFRDMSAASEYQSTLFSLGSNISFDTIFSSFTNYFNRSSIAAPFILVGFICAIVLIIYWVREHNSRQIALLLCCWLLPVDIIVVSNCYFLYHYFLLVLPSFISVLSFLRIQPIGKSAVAISMTLALLGTAVWWMLKKTGIDLVNYSTILLVSTHLLILSIFAAVVPKMRKYASLWGILVLTVCMLYWTTYSSALSMKYRNLRRLNQRSVEISALAYPSDFSNAPVLFLDGGTASFYKSAPSYSRYFFNLPMQRWKQGDHWEIQKYEYEKIMNYKGKYIIYSSWFSLDKYPELQKKLNDEYEKLPGSGIYHHSPNWNFFEYETIPDIQNTLENSETYILLRKETN